MNQSLNYSEQLGQSLHCSAPNYPVYPSCFIFPDRVIRTLSSLSVSGSRVQRSRKHSSDDNTQRRGVSRICVHCGKIKRCHLVYGCDDVISWWREKAVQCYVFCGSGGAFLNRLKTDPVDIIGVTTVWIWDLFFLLKASITNGWCRVFKKWQGRCGKRCCWVTFWES